MREERPLLTVDGYDLIERHADHPHAQAAVAALPLIGEAREQCVERRQYLEAVLRRGELAAALPYRLIVLEPDMEHQQAADIALAPQPAGGLERETPRGQAHRLEPALVGR